jgi:hypothetical protein
MEVDTSTTGNRNTVPAVLKNTEHYKVIDRLNTLLRFNMNKVSCVVILLLVEALVAYLFGAEMGSSNPDGIWLDSPPADGSGSPSDSFYVGASIGLFLVSLAYAAASISLYTWGKLNNAALSWLLSPLITSSLIGVFVTLAIGELAW